MLLEELKYFFKPVYCIEKEKEKKLLIFIVTLSFTFLFGFSSQFLLFLFDKIIDLNYGQSILKTIKESNKNGLKDIISNYTILFPLLYIPTIEELTFRLYLNLKKRYIYISFFIFYFTFILPFFKISEYLNYQGIYLFICFILCSFILKCNINYFILFFKKKYTLLFYISALVFGLVHIPNFSQSLPGELRIFSIIFILPQFFVGVFTAYLRIRLGLSWSILLHTCFNLPSLILYYFLS